MFYRMNYSSVLKILEVVSKFDNVKLLTAFVGLSSKPRFVELEVWLIPQCSSIRFL
jgi:hypothetical protein